MEHVITREEIIDAVRKTGAAGAYARQVRERKIARGQYIEGNAYTWYKSLHYSDTVWDVLKDRESRRKQARR